MKPRPEVLENLNARVAQLICERNAANSRIERHCADCVDCQNQSADALLKGSGCVIGKGLAIVLNRATGKLHHERRD